MTPDEGSAESSGTPSASAAAVRRSGGRGRYSRGRRRPRRSGNQPRRLPSAEASPESEAPLEGEAPREDLPRRSEERAREPLPPPFQPAKLESVQVAIDKVTAVIGDLRGVLNDMELVLEYLEDVERQQIADEREIEQLQQRLNSMHRRVDRFQPQPRPSQRATEESAEERD